MADIADTTTFAKTARVRLQELSSLLAENAVTSQRLFTHLDHAMRMVQRLDVVLLRMAVKSAAARDLRVESWNAQSKATGSEVPEVVRLNFDQLMDLNIELEMDFESLYRDGTVLLDEMAVIASRIAGIAPPTKYSKFIHVLMAPTKFPELLRPLWSEHRDQLIGHYGSFRLFRDKFVDHHDVPFTSSTGSSLLGADFKLTRFRYPTISEQEDSRLMQELSGILKRGPKDLQLVMVNYKGVVLFRILLKHLHYFDLPDIRRICNLALHYGFETDSFETVGTELLQLTIGLSTALLALSVSNIAGVRFE